MRRERFAALAIAALLVIAGALYFSRQRDLPQATQGAPFLPGLPGELDTVDSVTLRKGSPTPAVTLHRQSGHWTVAQRGDYAADTTKLRKLLLALTDAKIVEQKTSNPASFPMIGVEDPTKPGAGGIQIEYTDKSGTHSVIIGKSAGTGNFARRGGENTSYLVEPGVSVESEPRFWIDTKLIDIAASAIQSIAVVPATGPAYVIRRAASPASAAGAPKPATSPPDSAPKPDAAPGPFQLDSVPAGRKAADPQVIAPSPGAFSSLTADDVAGAGDIDFGKPATATLTLTNGNLVTFRGTVIGDKHWIEVTNPSDAPLTAKAAGRAFEVASYRYDDIFRPLESLLTPKPAPAEPKAHTPAAKPAPSH
jgi:hypothetical protein